MALCWGLYLEMTQGMQNVAPLQTSLLLLTCFVGVPAFIFQLCCCACCLEHKRGKDEAGETNLDS